MKIAILYNVVERATDGGYIDPNYDSVIRRFVDSYVGHQSGCDHDLYICSSGATLSAKRMAILSGLTYRVFTYFGDGWDIGAYQYCAKSLDSYDILVCMNSQAHVAVDGWLSAIVGAWKTYGPGVYGTSSSFEVAPHIRTSCLVVPPALLAKYPVKVRCRYDACLFEHSPSNFSLWARSQGYPVCVVLKSGVQCLADSRNQNEIFRRDSQAGLLIHDRHTQIYDAAPAEEREHLRALADGRITKSFFYLGVVDRLCARHRWIGAIRLGLSRLRKRFCREMNVKN